MDEQPVGLNMQMASIETVDLKANADNINIINEPTKPKNTRAPTQADEEEKELPGMRVTQET